MDQIDGSEMDKGMKDESDINKEGRQWWRKNEE